jgi:hypothetical protein
MTAHIEHVTLCAVYKHNVFIGEIFMLLIGVDTCWFFDQEPPFLPQVSGVGNGVG